MRAEGQTGWQRPGGHRGLRLPTLPYPLDVKKMPLGKLSKQQIARGFEALEALEVALRAPTDTGRSLEELSSHFYTVIPHNFGRSRPPPINSLELLQAKKDMLLVRLAGGPEGATRDWAREMGDRRPRRQTEGLRWAGQRTETWDGNEQADRGVGWPWPQSCGRQGRWEAKWTGKLPVPVTLGAGGHRAGPDPTGSPGGGGGRGATPPGPRLPAPQVPAPVAGPRGARVQGGLGPTEDGANSGHCLPTHLSSGCPEDSLALGLISLCLYLRRTLAGGISGGPSVSLALDIKLLLCLQVIHTYLKQTGSNSRCPSLQHVWKVKREGEVRQSPKPSPALL